MWSNPFNFSDGIDQIVKLADDELTIPFELDMEQIRLYDIKEKGDYHGNEF